MTRLVVLGSGSRGNAFAVVAGDDAVLVDAGFGSRTLARRAEAAGLDLAAVRAVALTHEHGDHARGGAALAAKLGVPVVSSRGTWRALGTPAGTAHHALRPTRPFRLDPFIFDSCLTTHDAAEPIALSVEAPDGARIAFAMDIGRPTAGVRYVLREANAVVVEANYDEVLLRTGRYPASVQQRIAGSRGHLSNRAAAELVAEVLHDGLGVVVLAHLSQESNTPERARAAVEPVLRARGYRGGVWVALQERPLPAISVPGAPDRDQGELALRWDAASAGRPG